jgi:hypothetical protein
VALAVNFTLSSEYWTSGCVDCIASLWYFNGHKNITLATLSFQVNAERRVSRAQVKRGPGFLPRPLLSYAST